MALTQIPTGMIVDAAITPAKMNGAQSGNAPVFGARAWVNFDGTGTTATNQTIRGQGNVSSVYKNGTGDYTITFATAMPDANYSWSFGGNNSADNTATNTILGALTTVAYQTASSLRIVTKASAGGGSLTTADHSLINIVVYR